MYRQAIMEAEQQQQDQILTKLTELPIVSDTCAQVLDIYERTKGHNILFRTYFGLAEYTAKAVAGTAVPVIYNGFKSPIDKVNDMACTQLDALEEKFPIITKPTQEVLREGQEQYDKVRPIVDPLVVKPAMVALDIGKTAMSTAVAPAKYAVHMGTAAIDSGKQAASQMASSVLARGQQVVDAGLTTPLGQFWVQQFDSALDATEKLVLNHYLPLGQGQDGDGEEKTKKEQVDVGGEEEGGSRRERVSALVRHVHKALYTKAEGDIVRYRMMAGNLLHEINEITTFYVKLMKDGADMAWKDRQEVVDAADGLWTKYAHFIPEVARPEDPVKRVVVVLSTLTGRLGELFTASSELTAMVNSHLSDKCQQFVQWCQQSSAVMKERVLEGGETVRERYADYMAQLASYLPHIMEMVHFLSDKALDTLDIFGIASRLRRQEVAEIHEEHKEQMEMNELQ